MSADLEIDLNEVRRMASLSRLDISPGEEELFAAQFSSILGYMATLQAVNTDGIEPLYNPAVQPELQREDVAESRFSRREILANAPETDGEMFIVPKIV